MNVGLIFSIIWVFQHLSYTYMLRTMKKEIEDAMADRTSTMGTINEHLYYEEDEVSSASSPEPEPEHDECLCFSRTTRSSSKDKKDKRRHQD